MRDDFNYFRALAVLFILLCLSAGCGSGQGDELYEMELTDASGGEDMPEEEENNEDDGESCVYVHVCGAVKSPGVYRLDREARVFEAVRAAGGLTEDAAGEYINQAETVADGGRIYVPTVEETQQDGTGVGETKLTGNLDGNKKGKVNINTAGKDELMELTGIGEAKAQSILDYREEHGRFKTVEELMQVEGIKEGVFNKIKENITI